MMNMFNTIRQKVSLNKIRYQSFGYDLDLTYISPKIIAMGYIFHILKKKEKNIFNNNIFFFSSQILKKKGYPSESLESTYRNPMIEVQKFLNSFHNDHYLVYNLCSERGYPLDK